METLPLNARPETYINSAAAKNTKNSEQKPGATAADPSPGKLPAAAKEVTLSNESLKLAAANNVTQANPKTTIQNADQAKESVRQLMENLQKNPAQALTAQNDILPSIVKSLLA